MPRDSGRRAGDSEAAVVPGACLHAGSAGEAEITPSSSSWSLLCSQCVLGSAVAKVTASSFG